MVRIIDPEKNDFSMNIVNRFKNLANIGHKDNGVLDKKSSIFTIGKLLEIQLKKIDEIYRDHLDLKPKIVFKKNCDIDENFYSQKFQNFKYFPGYTNFDQNKIYLCVGLIKNEAHLRANFEREFSMYNFLAEKKIQEKKVTEEDFGKFALKSCYRSFQGYFENDEISKEKLKIRKEMARTCAVYYTRVQCFIVSNMKNRGLNLKNYPFDIWARYSRDFVTNASYVLEEEEEMFLRAYN